MTASRAGQEIHNAGLAHLAVLESKGVLKKTNENPPGGGHGKGTPEPTN